MHNIQLLLLIKFKFPIIFQNITKFRIEPESILRKERVRLITSEIEIMFRMITGNDKLTIPLIEGGTATRPRVSPKYSAQQ